MDKGEISVDGLEAELTLTLKFKDGHVLRYCFNRNGSVFGAALNEFIAHFEEKIGETL